MTIDELIRICEDESDINELIRVSEARQVKALGRIADAICERPGVRLVLLAGASAAGKTTTAKRLCTQLCVNGRSGALLSTDDYFVDAVHTPRNAQGERDYEHVEAVDIPRFVADLSALFRGETIVERRYDFQRHCGYDSERKRALPPGGIVVVEGIHALNPLLTEGLAEEMKFRVFVEPKTQLTVFADTRLPIEAARFMRRVVRDCHFRKVSPQETLRMWPNVLAGEKRWIDPFRPLLDALFDSGLDYEAVVLKPYVEAPLRQLNEELGGEPNITCLLSILDRLPTVSPKAVPGDSILRETIGGSQLEY